MHDQASTDKLVERLLEATRSALSAAKIEHAEGLTRALALRDEILADLWGFSDNEDLPEATATEQRRRRGNFGNIKTRDKKALQQLEADLFRALEMQRSRLRSSLGQVERGGRLADDLKDIQRAAHRPRFDARG